MNLYHLETYDSFQTPSGSCGTVPDYAELRALLNLVIPTTDVWVAPIDAFQASNATLSSPERLERAFQTDSPRFLSDLVASPRLDSEQIADWIEPMPYHRAPSPFLSEAPFQDSLAFLLEEDAFITRKTRGNEASQCQIAGCHTKKQSNGRCIRHGGGRRCVVQGCTRGAQSMGRCKRHGGGARCTIQGCTTSSQGGGLCRTHGGGKLCTAPGCKKGAQRQGKCATHTSRKCSVANCARNARAKGICSRHRREAEAVA